MGFSRQDYWSGLPISSPGDLPDLGIELRSPAVQANSLPSEPLLEILYVDDKTLLGRMYKWSSLDEITMRS